MCIKTFKRKHLLSTIFNLYCWLNFKKKIILLMAQVSFIILSEYYFNPLSQVIVILYNIRHNTLGDV